MYLPIVVCHSIKYSAMSHSHKNWNGSSLDYDMHYVGYEYQIGFLFHVLLQSELQSFQFAAYLPIIQM